MSEPKVLGRLSKYFSKLFNHKNEPQPYYRDRNIRNTLYRQGEEIKKLRETERIHKKELEKLIEKLEGKIEGGFNLAKAQEIYVGLKMAAEENPLIRDNITTVLVNNAMYQMSTCLMSHPEFQEKLGRLYEVQRKTFEAEKERIEALGKLEEMRARQKRRFTRLIGTTVTLTALVGLGTYMGKGYYDIKFQGQTTYTLRKADEANLQIIEKVSKQVESDKEAKMKTDAQTLIRINNLESLLNSNIVKTSNIVEDISTHIAKRGEYELETEEKIKKLEERSTKAEKEKAEELIKLDDAKKKEREEEQNKRIERLEEEIEFKQEKEPGIVTWDYLLNTNK